MKKDIRLFWALAALVASALLLAGPLGAGSPSSDWPQFRGLERDGVSLETGLLAKWPEGGPKELWRLKWHKKYDTDDPAPDWESEAPWMKKYKDY